MKDKERLADGARFALYGIDGHPFALYGADGQYHGSFPCESSARNRVEELANTDAYIGEGFQIVKFP
jgi:hypothetical protein